MVSQSSKSGSTVFSCEECGFAYAENEWARKCEGWCRAHKSCNLEITRHALRV
ncbi:hypothetical protein HYS54_04015 [Candidatus Micrarchaeota archaeon]|nr:hypothetical protein [Candidatus Micrarchaeota archaeon]